MELITTRIKGMEDVVPADVHKWQTVESVAADVAENYGFREIRIPTFENTDLFVRSVGETTDVVQKEMFTVMGRESRFTLRPEGTAGTIRAVLQNGRESGRKKGKGTQGTQSRSPLSRSS